MNFEKSEGYIILEFTCEKCLEENKYICTYIRIKDIATGLTYNFYKSETRDNVVIISAISNDLVKDNLLSKEKADKLWEYLQSQLSVEIIHIPLE